MARRRGKSKRSLLPNNKRGRRERGYYRQTVAELIEETSAARKLIKKMEKEEEKEGANSDKPGKCEEEAEVSTDKEKKEDKGEKEEGANLESPLQLSDTLTSQPADSSTDIDASIQKTNLNSLQAVVETQLSEASESSQELDAGLQLDNTGQVTEYHLDDKEVKDIIEEEEEKERKMPKSRWTRTWSAPRGWPWYWSWMKMWSWSWTRMWPSPRPWSWPWRRLWPAPRDIQLGDTTQEEQEEKSLIPWPDRDLGAANGDPRTQTEGLVREGLDTKAETKNSLGGPMCLTEHSMGRMSCRG